MNHTPTRHFCPDRIADMLVNLCGLRAECVSDILNITTEH